MKVSKKRKKEKKMRIRDKLIFTIKNWGKILDYLDGSPI